MHARSFDFSSWAGRILRSMAALGALLGVAAPSHARPGTHPIVVSTWDARASSVVLGYRHGSFDGGALNVVSYHANFSATSGKLSSQFGLYYVNMSNDGDPPTAHGMAGSATAVFNLPVARRFDNGLPLAAIDFYVGSAPTALISGERNYLTLPLALGFGVPVTPVKALSLTPWFEFSPSVNLDTVIHPYDFNNENPADYIDPLTGDIRLTSADVERVISGSVELDTSVAVGARGGLDASLHASDYVDFNVSAGLSSIGTAFSGTRVLYLGGGFTWRWDDIVPAVLPADKRLLHESCDDVEQRFRSCENSRKWRSPEDIERLYGPQPASGQAAPPPAPPTVPKQPAIDAAPTPTPTPASTPSDPALSGSVPAQP